MVSNEDREAAIALAADAIAGFPDEAKHFIDDATEAVDALVSHGWGPKPTVTLKRIQEYGRFDQLITGYLESRGIEVVS